MLQKIATFQTASQISQQHQNKCQSDLPPSKQLLNNRYNCLLIYQYIQQDLPAASAQLLKLYTQLFLYLSLYLTPSKQLPKQSKLANQTYKYKTQRVLESQKLNQKKGQKHAGAKPKLG
eukprot:TRINITY_DN566_c6_g1_i2.p5 TRINITY_DN566_c6_g1~~TRINITY_DN566_c6_g1_i2.p5  ORF type:complete len:119 (-),score=1.45 TRINITY_DN566_c6_g1_i2:1873-2229(-)